MREARTSSIRAGDKGTVMDGDSVSKARRCCIWQDDDAKDNGRTIK